MAALGDGDSPRRDVFAMLTPAQMASLLEAGAGGVEIVAYAMLSRFHDGPRGLCTMDVAAVACELRRSPNTVMNAVQRLSRRRYGWPPRPVIERVERGRYGHTSVYADNLWVDMGYRKEGER